MVKWLMHMWCGYLCIIVTGTAPERFFNICRMQGIEIWEICKTDQGYQCRITLDGFLKSRPLVRKAKVRLRIQKRFGLPFFLYKNRKRKGLALGMGLFILVLCMMTCFVWDITFQGNLRYTDEQLLDYLQEQKIQYGMLKYRISCEELEEKIRLDFPEITWVSARVSGTRLLIYMKENDVLQEKEEERASTETCDLVAKKEGLICSLTVRSGIPKVHVGERVEAGQILVEGKVPIINDAKEVIREQFVMADAEVMAQCITPYQDIFPMMHQEKSHTGKKRNGLYLEVLGKTFVWILPAGKERCWDVVTQVYPLVIWEDFRLPVSWGFIEAKEYITYDAWYSKKEASEKAERKLSEILWKFTQKGMQILENDVKVISDGSNCIVEGTITTMEDIACPQTIPVLDEGKKQADINTKKTEEILGSDEYNGDNH